MKKLNEDNSTEQPVLDWFKEMGYEYMFGPDIAPMGPYQERITTKEVLLLDRLKRSLKRINQDMSDAMIDLAIRKLQDVEHPALEFANKATYEMLTKGVPVEERQKEGEYLGKRVAVFDFNNPSNNEFLVVNQFAVEGLEVVRRPDVVVFINGIPIAVFELKNPTDKSATLATAYRQLQDYKKDIPELFKYNQVLVISDLTHARHGTISSPWERFSAWKGVESEDENISPVLESPTLVQGIFEPERLIDIIRNFIVFEADSVKDVSTYTKKMALYHQYYGVNKAVAATLKAMGPNGNRKIGYFWHTQGSGKSLSMVFYVNKVRRLAELAGPTFVFLTDRNDLDGQFHKTFLHNGYPLAWKADKIDELKKRLRTAGGELIFTTIQKFDEPLKPLTDKQNVIVIADEAHRSQYRKFAGNVRDALPNAGFLGITGTPIELSDRSTQAVFGKLISAYPIQRSVEDKATVPIYYEGRLVPLHLTNDFIDDEYDELVSEFSSDVQEKTKRKLSRLAGLIGTPDRLEKIAQDIIQHFNSRPVEGKAMVVTVSRQVAVDLYNIMTKIPGAPEMAVVISNSEEFQGKIQSELNNHVLEENFKNNGHSLKMAIVCDMWLTGFDVPSLNTMYIDKPLKNHTLMQAIARVNRVFKDKPGGLIVDYIGIADDLKKALSIYSSDVRKEALIPLEEIINKMRVKYDEVRGMLADVSYSNWKDLKGAELSGLIGLALDVLVDKPDGKNRFVDLVGALSRMFALAMPHEEARQIIQDVEFFQALRQIILKQLVVGIGGVGVDIESAIRDLVSKNIAAEGVIDIFGSKGTAKPEISIFDEKFIEQIKKTHLKNLAAETLRKLLEDELRGRRRQNDIRYASLADILRDIIEKYENGIINSSQVIEELLKLAKDVQSAADEGKKLGLSEEELAFYDAIVVAKKSDLKEGPLKELVRELVQLIRRDLSVDWTSSDIIKSKIRANVRLLLLQRGIIVKEEENLIERILNQAITLYRDLIPART